MEIINRSDVMNLSKKYKLVGYGAGLLGERTHRFLNNTICYFIDREPSKWGGFIDDGPGIFSIEKLKKEEASSTIIIMCTEHYKEVQKMFQRDFPEFDVRLSPLLSDYGHFESLHSQCSSHLFVTAFGVAGGMYIIDCKTEKVKKLCDEAFRGVAFIGDQLYVASEKGEIGRVESLNPFIYEVKHAAKNVRQMHGLAYWEKEHMLVAAETEYDCLSFYDADDFTKKREISISPYTGANQCDRCHINDLHIEGDTLFYSVLSKSGWWKQGLYDGGVYAIDLISSEKKTVIESVNYPHSIGFIGNSFYVLESMRGRLITGRQEVIFQLNGFLRGLDGDEELLYVGQSRNRRLDETRHYYSPISIDSGVYVLNRKEQLYRFIKVPEMCDVYSIVDLEKKPNTLI
jgi:hypothetical protein